MQYGWTPLLEACELGNFPIVNALLNHGATIEHKSQVNSDVFCLDVREFQPKSKYSIMIQDGSSCIFAAVLHGHYEVVQLLLYHNADINIVNKVIYPSLRGILLDYNGMYCLL